MRTTSRLRNVNGTKALKIHIFAYVSHLRGMHRWERSGSQSHSASSQMHLDHWRGRAVHRGPKKISHVNSAIQTHALTLIKGENKYINSQTSGQLPEGKAQPDQPEPARLGSPG